MNKAEEERKRARMYDPVVRWRQLQENLTWTEANLPPELRRNTSAAAKKREAKLLEYFERNTRR